MLLLSPPFTYSHITITCQQRSARHANVTTRTALPYLSIRCKLATSMQSVLPAQSCSKYMKLLHRSIKSIIAESYGPVGQARVIGYTTAGYSIGTIAGPTIGGVLASPCDTFLSGSGSCTAGAWLFDRCGITSRLTLSLFCCQGLCMQPVLLTSTYAVQLVLSPGDKATCVSPCSCSMIQLSADEPRMSLLSLFCLQCL